MDATTLAALPVFACLGGAIWLLLVALLAPPQRSATRLVLRRRIPARVQAAVAVGLATAVLTRWPVAALAAAALVWCWPMLFGGGGEAKRGIERLDALASWTESLKDTIAGAIGLDEAIPATAAAAAPPIRPAVQRLVDGLRAREPLSVALERFAADLDDPSADLVVAALILNARLRGPGLRSTLEALATSARDELDLRRKVDAGRRALRTGVKIIVGVSVGFVAVLALLDSAYLDPYDTATGQAVLVVVAAVFAAAFAWLRTLGRDPARLRLLDQAATTSGAGR
ncbi:MAG: type II secretion system F family protein [Sporichthyaceae bacterium]